MHNVNGAGNYLTYISGLVECCGTGYLKNFGYRNESPRWLEDLIEIKNSKNFHVVYNRHEDDVGNDGEEFFEYEGGFRGAVIIAQLTHKQQPAINFLKSLGFIAVHSNMNKNSGNQLTTLVINPDDLNEVLEKHE